MVANTYFVEVDEEDIDIRNESQRSDARDNDFIMDSCGGVPVVPIRPELITSTDDSTVFIFVELLLRRMNSSCY